MKLSEIKTLLENRITTLESQKNTFIEVWNIEWVIWIENEIDETKQSLNEING